MLHNIRSIFQKKKTKVALILLILVGITAIAATARAWSRSARSKEPPTTAKVVGVDTSAAKPSQLPRIIEAELVTIRPWGFEPREINRPPGPFFLAVDNYSELTEINVSLHLEAGPRVNSVSVTKSRLKWRERLVLTPGTYVLKEANHPEWTCRITITHP